MKRFSVICFLIGVLAIINTNNASADILFESGTLGPTAVPWSDVVDQTVFGANVSSAVFDGVRFELTAPAVIFEIGGHFVAPTSSTFFGAIVKLDDDVDFPNSGDLSTPDVLGVTLLTFPAPSAEVFGNLALSLDPGWYALVFGSGLYGAAGNGAMPLNNPDIGTQSYIAFVSSHWKNSAPTDGFEFKDFRFVVKGSIIPEPNTLCLTVLILCLASVYGQTRFRLRFNQ